MIEVNGDGKISKAIREIQEKLEGPTGQTRIGANVLGQQSRRRTIVDTSKGVYDSASNFGSSQTTVPRWG